MFGNSPVASDEFESQFWRAPVIDRAVALDPQADAPAIDEFRLLADNMPTLCWIARGDGYIYWYNKRWHDYCGSTPDAMAGWGWQSVHDPERLPEVIERWSASIASGEPFEMVFPLKGADGVFRNFITRVAPFRDASGDLVRWFGTNTEIEGQLRTERALQASEAKFGVLTDAMPQMVWSTRPDGFHDYYNARWYEFTGASAGSTDGEAWSEIVHPDDRDRASERWRHSLATGEPYEIEYRLRHTGGEYRWALGRALPVRDGAGDIVRWIGTCTDIDEFKRASEQVNLLSRELSHRIKNIFAVIAGLIGLSAIRDPANREFARRLGDRIAALGRAHDYARPHSDLSRPTGIAVTLHGLFAEIVKPYREEGDERVTIAGDDVAVDERGATPIALVVHELATNAIKYGALATPHGRVMIASTLSDNEVVIRWSETGGPVAVSPPGRQGFGSLLSEASIEGQLGGTINRDWNPEGLTVEIRVDPNRLARPA